MKFAVSSLAFVLAATVGSAFAAGTPAKPMTAQQSKMSTCSKDAHAKGLKGAEYKSFMSTCLKGGEAAAPAAAKPAAAAPVATAKETQQTKMKNCNAEAKTKALKGAARKTFMSTCLKGDAAPAAAAH
ncbi:MAG: hypothetical protein KGI64_09875 [Xanthomonadaceae bacterium]|nr:hypothetical protein [Xanthomonadaceae bacterium]MDE2085157.1 hypothetical protein [Xanthomonadaceae bacterium]